MNTYPSQHKHYRRRDQRSNLQRVLLTLMILCILGITGLVFVIAQEYMGHTPLGQQPTPPPVVSVSPTPISSPTPTPTQMPTPTPTPTQAPTPTPTPLPTPPPGVLGYPLYGGNPHLPEIALTFDDGPNPSYTHQILAVLQQYHVKATFFVIGSEAAAYLASQGTGPSPIAPDQLSPEGIFYPGLTVFVVADALAHFTGKVHSAY